MLRLVQDSLSPAIALDESTRAAVAEGLRTARTLEEAGRLAVEAVGRHLAWSVGVLWLLDERSGALRCARVAGGPGAGQPR